MSELDLTTFTERNDVNNRLSRTSTTETFTGLQYVDDCGAYYDFGAGFFTGRAYAEDQYTITSATGTPAAVLDGFSDTIASDVGTVSGALFRMFANSTSVILPGCILVESSSASGQSTSVALSTATLYYRRVGFLSSLSRYGALFVQIFSDSGRSTLVTTTVKPRTANANYQYYYSSMSVNFTGTNSITGTHAHISLFYPTAGTDLTAYTTSGATLATYADVIQATALTSVETSYTIKDLGAGNIAGNFTFYGVLNQTSWPSGTNGLYYLNSISNSANSGFHDAIHAIGIRVEYLSSTTAKISVAENNASSVATSTGTITHTLNSPIFLKLRRDTSVGTYGTVYIQAYSDPAFGITIGSEISLALRENIDYRYHYPIQSGHAGGTSSATFTFGGIIPPASVSSYSITSSGGAVIGGSSTTKIGQKFIASGGAVSGGSSLIVLGQKVISVGGGVLGGTASQYGTYTGTASYSITSSGGMIAGGSSTIKLGLKILSSGGMVIGGSSVISVAYAPGLTEYVYTETVVDSTGTPITGAGSKTTIFLKNIDTGYIMDWSDVTMKASGWGQITDLLSEAIYPAGEYGYNVPLSGLANGRYCATLKYSPTTPSSSDPIQTFQIEFYVIGGYIVDQYMSGRLDANISSLLSATQKALTLPEFLALK